jgi:hypothetical protein
MGFYGLLFYSEYNLGVCEVEGRLCGLVVRLPGCRLRGPEFDSRRYLIF